MKTAVQVTMYLDESDKWHQILQTLRNESVAGASAFHAIADLPAGTAFIRLALWKLAAISLWSLSLSMLRNTDHAQSDKSRVLGRF